MLSSTILPVSLSILAAAFAQAPAPAVVSINVAGQGAPAPAAQSSVLPAANGGATAIPVAPQVTIVPQGVATSAGLPAAAPVPAAATSALAPAAPAAPAPAPAPAGSTGIGVSANGVPVWVVKVGSQNNDLTFSPSTIQAKPGEMIQFQFYAKVRDGPFRSVFLQQQTDILGRIIPSPHLPSMRLACHS
jgi:hypothetical protein